MSGKLADDLSDMTEVVGLDLPRVDIVDKAASGHRFALIKGAEGGALLDADQVEDLLKQAQEEGDDTVTDTVTKADDELDVTEPLADADLTPTEQVEANTPGSPAWERIDAATAMKWAAILARTKNALTILADREATEAISADPDDQVNAWDLEDAACAIDYALSVLGSYAVAESAEAEISDEMEAVGKSLEQLSEAVTVIESSTAIVKAGRVLSASNESSLREASDLIQKVLASLPAPVEETGDVAKAEDEPVKEAPVAKATLTINAEAVRDTVNKATDQLRTELGYAPLAKALADAGHTDAALAVLKAGKPLQPVYDENGNLVGLVDPEKVQPLATAPASSGDSGDDTSDDPDAPAADDTVGTPADAPAAPAAAPAAPAAPAAAPADGDTTTTDQSTDDDKVQKAQVEAIVKEALAQEREQTAALVKSLQDELVKLTAPAPARVHANGARPDPSLLRGQDQADATVTKADAEQVALLKSQVHDDNPVARNSAASELQQRALAQLNLSRKNARRI